jgi:predicted amidohydrolase YtcJ
VRTLFTADRIRTGEGDGRADWLLADDGVIEAIGTEPAPQADRVVELEGIVVPAFRDGHVHLPATGLYAAGMDFRDQRSAQAIVAAFVDRADAGGVLFGGNFEEPLDAPITRHDLDHAVGPRPALLARADMHSCIVSSALLDELDVDDLEGVDREDGSPTGYLRERAASEAWRYFDSSLTAAQQREAVLRAVEIAYSKGVAEAHEMFVVEWRGWDSADRFLEVIREVSLNVPVYLGTDEIERVQDLGFRKIGGDYFLDGSFGSHSAWLAEPYEAAPPSGSSPTGISYRSDEEVYSLFSHAQRAGMQAGCHAIGDAAIEQALRTWERVAQEAGVERVRALRHRIEHFECSSADQMRRAAHLGIAASIQPAFDRFWGGEQGLYARRIGWDRAQEMNRFGSMMAAGLVVGGGSDSTVTPLDPFLQMAALRAHNLPEESLAAAQALAAMTSGVAALAPQEGHRGPLVAGAWAEFCLLDRDPLEVDPEELLKTEVLGTWVAGRRVWPESEAETA